jgi:tRNA wybutosine-synthesizing protein 1
MTIENLKRKDLCNQGYKLVGNHSAVKICEWTKRSLRGENCCYKEQFYDTKSHRCVQMTPAINTCTHRCLFCWRDIDFTKPKWFGKVDDPKSIVDGCIKQFQKGLEGYKGYKKVDMKKFKQTFKPKQFAISLSGEPTLYPKLPELILELKKRKINSFLVTNGTNPSMLKKLLQKKAQPTQLYITLPAPDEETYIKICNPLIKDGWKKINESLKVMVKFKRNVMRLTLVKNLNMIKPEKYSEIIKKYKPSKIECKAYMHLGHSRSRLEIYCMPYYEDIKEFTENLAKLSGYKIIDEKKDSRVFLLVKA